VEFRGPAQVPQATGAFLDRLEAEPVAVEAPRPVEVLAGILVTARAAASGVVMTVGSMDRVLSVWTGRELETHRGS
jgi:type II secretory pathway component PulC